MFRKYLTCLNDSPVSVCKILLFLMLVSLVGFPPHLPCISLVSPALLHLSSTANQLLSCSPVAPAPHSLNSLVFYLSPSFQFTVVGAFVLLCMDCFGSTCSATLNMVFGVSWLHFAPVNTLPWFQKPG